MRTIIFVFLISLSHFTAAQSTQMRLADKIRLAEAFHLADMVQDSIWTGWSRVPFVVLLVTSDQEFLIGHPAPPKDFKDLGHDERLKQNIFVRKATGKFSPHLLATFPAIAGVNTVVVGQPENTGKTSTLWVITLLHEHFHQLQFSQPGYYAAVDRLNLSGSDQTGMWQLNYPFPYENPNINLGFRAFTASLREALDAQEPELRERVKNYLQKRASFVGSLTEADYRYFSFQLWQEGVARYTEFEVTRRAAELVQPSPEFRALPDFQSFTDAMQTLTLKLKQELSAVDMLNEKRVVFYPTGAAEALLLDRTDPAWKTHYFEQPFFLEQYRK